MKSTTSAFVATIIVAVLAVALGIFAFSKSSKDKELRRVQGAEEPAELSKDIQDSAEKLIRNDYEVVKLFFIRGLPHEDEPYGNTPEDGYYKVDSETYKTAEDVEKIVDETFVPEEAEKIKTQSFGAVYKTKDDGSLGINAKFKPDTDYPVIWTNPQYSITHVSAAECTLSLTLEIKKDDGTTEKKTEDYKLEKTDGVWKLKNIIY
jgi:hypothetical protein